jgi:hypothetical protein
MITVPFFPGLENEGIRPRVYQRGWTVPLLTLISTWPADGTGRGVRDGQGGRRPRGIQDGRAQDAGHGRRARGRARGEGASAGRRLSGSGTRDPRFNVLIVGIHGCSFACECTNER